MMARFFCARRLNSVDLPTFGRPTKATLSGRNLRRRHANDQRTVQHTRVTGNTYSPWPCLAASRACARANLFFGEMENARRVAQPAEVREAIAHTPWPAQRVVNARVAMYVRVDTVPDPRREFPREARSCA